MERVGAQYATSVSQRSYELRLGNLHADNQLYHSVHPALIRTYQPHLIAGEAETTTAAPPPTTTVTTTTTTTTTAAATEAIVTTPDMVAIKETATETTTATTSPAITASAGGREPWHWRPSADEVVATLQASGWGRVAITAQADAVPAAFWEANPALARLRFAQLIHAQVAPPTTL